jgi:hypothetical protein
MRASIEGHAEVVQLLVAAGADVHALDEVRVRVKIDLLLAFKPGNLPTVCET